MHSGLTPNGASLYVPDNSSSVRVINTSTNAVVATITVGSTPRSVAVTPDGTKAYVANYSSNTVSVINTATNTVTATITVGSVPNRVVISPDGTKAYVANYSGNSVSVINTATNTVTATIAIGQSPWSIVINPAGTRLYTGNVNHGTVSVINATTNLHMTNVTVGSSPHEVEISTSGDRVFAANYSSGSVSVINTTTNTVASTITGFSNPMALATSIDDATLYVGQYGFSTVRMVNLSNNTLGSTIAVGSHPWTITRSAGGDKMYVTNYSPGSITVVNGTGSAPSAAVTIDRTAPTATWGSPAAGTTTFPLTFNENVSGIAAADFINAGTSTGCVFAPSATTASASVAINIVVTGCSTGTLIPRILANTVADTPGNTGPAADTTAASVGVDGVPGGPVATWTVPTSPFVTTAAISATLAFNEPIIGLTASDISVSGSATGCTVGVTGSSPGTSFTVTASSCTEGTVVLTLAPSSVTDEALNAGPGTAATANTVTRTITGLSSPYYSALSRNGDTVWVSNTSANTVMAYNTSTGAAIASIAVGASPRGIALSPAGDRLAVANMSANSVSIINTSTNAVVGTVTGVGTSPMGVAWSPNGRRVWVSNISSNTVASIDVPTLTLETSGIATGAYPNAIVVSPDGTRVYTANVNSNSVTVINATTSAVVTTVNVGANPYHLDINSSGTRLAVANYGNSTVSVLNPATNAVISTVTGLSNPMGIDFSPDGSRAYIANRGSLTVRAIDFSVASPVLLSTPNISLSSQSPWGLAISADGRTMAATFDVGARVMLIDTGLAQSAPWVVDRTAPTLTSIASDNTSPNDLNEQSWTVTFSEDVTGVTASDFALSGTSTGWSNIAVSGSGRTRTVTATNSTPPAGTVILTLTPDSVTDVAGSTGPAAGAAASAVTFAPSEGVFRVDAYSTTGFSGLEVAGLTGDDRGGMALTTGNVLLTGDSNIARWGHASLSNGTVVAATDGTWMDATASDLKTLRAYAFNINSARTGSLTTLTALDSSTGLRTNNVITLSTSIPLGGSSPGIFSGYGRIVVYASDRVWDISLPSGTVTNRGTMPAISRSMSESWASWGVAEYFGGRLYLSYVKSATAIERARVPDGQVTTVSTFGGLADMASFVVNPRNGRWYFHYEGPASSFGFGSDETIGFANATVNLGGTTPDPVTNLVASTRSTTALLTWTAPAAGPAPTDYLVEYTKDNGATWTWVNDGVSTATNASVPSLTPGDNVRFRVTTVANLNASAPVTTESSVVSPFASAPAITSVTTGNTQLTVNFTAPTVAGASAITNYQWSTDGGTTWTARTPTSTASPLVITGLTNGTSYGVTLRAVNSNGNGDAAITVNATPSTVAGAPAITSVTPSATQTLSVAFTAPSSDGGSTITNYQYSLNGGASWTTRSPVAVTSPLVITGLTNGSSYTVVLRAVNVNGGGTSSNAVAAIPGVPPGAPTISSVSTSDANLSVIFSAPASNGSIAITNYEYSTDGTNWTARTPASTASPLVITGLTNGTSYTVRVRAVNPAGSGAASSSATGTPSRVPDAPVIDSIEPSSGRLRVSYSAPAFNGGATVTNYEYSTDNGSTWTALNPVSTTGTFSITSLANARTYAVRVRAVNLRGAGKASAAVDGTPATTPGAPTISGIAPSSGRLDVSFMPGADGGAAPTNYQWSTDDGATWTTRNPASTASPITITGLTNGSTYAVRIRSVNSQGAGGASAASDGTPATTPGAPTISSVTGSNTRLSVAVTPGSTGGAAITNYEYSTDNGGTWTLRTPASAASPIVIGGLQNGTDYQVRVRAVNSQGAGAASNAVQARPATTPGAPTIDGITGDPGQLTVALSAPASDGGNTVSNYEYSTNGGTTWTTRNPASTASPLVVTGLTDGTVYAVRVRAVNAQGAGTASASVEGVPVNVPGAPAINNVISGSGFLRVDFSAAAARGTAVTNYEYSLDNGSTWVTPSPATVTSPLTVNNLTNGTTYQIVLRGVNSRGSGVSSTMVAGTPSAPPAAPTITGIQVGGVSGSLSVAFTAGSTGGAAISDTEYSVDGGTSWSSAGTATSPVTITGLTNGSTYSVKLRSVNVRGAGAASTAVSGTPIWVPGSPSLSSVTGSDQTLTLIFSPPADTGGSTITNYEYSTDGGTTWTTRSPASTARPLVVTGLTNGTAYNVAVRGMNAKGPGVSSNTIGAKPATVPGAPSITGVTASHTSLSVAFTAPASDGGEAVSNYEYSIDNGQTWTARNPSNPTSPLLITALNNATDYTVKLRAMNVRGAGPASTGTVGRPAGAPNAPVVSQVDSTDGGLSVAFVAGSDNGATITNAEYSTDNGVTWTTRSPVSTASPLVISGLANGTAYQVRVRMVNAQGSGTASTATSATPATTPSAPTIDSITGLDAALSAAVTAGSNGGAAITSWEFSTDNGVTWSSTGSVSTTVSIPSLVNGTSYAVRIRATNRMGAGAASAAVSGVPSRVAYAPSITGITPGNGRLTVTFTEGSNGGAATSTLRWSVNGGASWTSRQTAGTASPLVITGLTNGTTYPVKVQMVNQNGNGDPSLPVDGTPSTTPGAPTIASVTPGNRSLTVAVTAPSDNGGDAIANYEYSLNNGATWAAEATAVSSGSFTVSSLTNGTTYAVKVRAVNGRGAGTASASSSGTPSTVPGMPAITSVTPGNGQVDVAFSLGASGGAAVTNLQYSIDDGATWSVRNPVSTASPLTITGLVNGVTYPIRLRAVNTNGPGVSSRASGTPATAPDKPTITRIVPGDGTLTVEFEPPADNGGAVITNYAYSVDGGSFVVLSPASVNSPLTVTGLTNGTDASVVVAAINSQGRGASSDPVTGNPATLPGAPTISGPTVGDGTLNINWYVIDDGGRPVTSVDYSLNDGDTWTNVPGDSSPVVVTGLSNGTTYDVRLRVRTAIGASGESARRQLTPASPPSAPTIGSVARADGALTVNFSAGFDGGSAVTNWEYSTDGGSNWVTPSPSVTASPINITGLSNGVTYPVKVRGVNARGSGTASTSVNGTPATVAAAPTISSITGGDGTASVAFTLGAANGASVTNLEYSVNDGLSWTARNPASTAGPLLLSGLENGTPYRVRLRAVNAMGTGSQGAAVSVTPARVPDAPTITAATGENGRAVIAFSPNGDGGSAITNYAWSSDNGVTWTVRSPASTVGPIIITGLTNGTTYPVRLKAINNVGQSAESAASDALPSGPPLAPTITSVTGSNGTLSVAFTAGATGGAQVTSYQASTDGGATWSDTAALSSPLTLSGLVNGVTYSVAIRAVNSRGPGAASSTENGVPATVPDALQITQVISASGAVDIAFSLGGNGGSPISNIAWSIDGGDNWTVRSPASTAGPLRLTGLTNGTTYPVRIRAINDIGSGAVSSAVDALPATTPGAPVVTSVTSGNGNLMVAFNAPASTGGAPVLNYQYSLDGGDNWANAAASASPIEINNVTVGTEYDVAIRAVNLRGPGVASNAATKRATAPPAAPTITSVQEGNGEIVVRYAPPSDNGGDTLQDYFFSLDGGVTWSNTASAQSLTARSGGIYASREYASVASLMPTTVSTPNSLRLSNLVNGQSYGITLRASNVDTLGVPSTAVQGIPSTVPGAPRNLAVTAGNATVSVNWDVPLSDGGLTITKYEYSIDGGTVWNDVAETPTVVRGLRNGSDYAVKVRAFNGNGAGPATAPVNVRPTTVPRAPGAPAATAGTNSATVTWTAPSDTGGAAVTDYVIEWSNNGGNTWQTVTDGVSTSTSVLVTNLTAGSSYVFRVTAVNANGRSETSMASDPAVPAAPAAAAPAPVAEPVITPVVVPAPKGDAPAAVTPVKKTKKKTEPQTPVAVPLPDVSMPMDNTEKIDVTDGAGTVFGMPATGWVDTSFETTEFAVRTSEKIKVTLKVSTGGTKITRSGMPVFLPGEELDIAVTGLLPGSETSAWIFSTPTLLGRGTADASGALRASYPLPAGIGTGLHTVQLNTIATDGTMRSVEIKVEVRTVAPPAQDEGTTAEPADGNSMPTGLILMAALLGLVLAAGAVIGLRRRNSRED
ncbi:MAG: fibronectin type III domain-containing protein [Actinomycetota bacterium]